ncbi:MAG: adenylate/guanylate cyclase domain-containing protein [Halopseudomonas sp.]
MLAMPCPECSYLNPKSCRFCCHCGHALSISSDSPHHDQAEKRQLTVMFCDLVGSTQLSQHLDPEDLRDIILAFQQQCASVIDSFGGYIARYMGDGMLVYFGYPVANELDTERAVRAGLAIVEQIHNIDTGEHPRLQVRIGIETGIVIAGDIIGEGGSLEHSVLGDTPNIAARLQATACPDTVVIGPGTFQIINRYFDFTGLGLQTLKGISKPLYAYQITSVRDDHRHAAASAILGRDEQLHRIAKHLNGARQGSVIVIEGDSGFGKSRLLDHSIDRVSEVYQTALLRCSPFYSDRPLYPVIRHWLALLDAEPTDDYANIEDKLLRVLEGIGVIDHNIVSLIGATLSHHTKANSNLSAQELRNAKLNALIEAVKAFSKHKPLLIAVEDAHWIDSSTAEFLIRLSEQIESLPMVLMITSREPVVWLTKGLSNFELIRLVPLTDSVSSELVQTLCGQNKISEAAREEIIQRADGSPLYIEELTKTVLEQKQSHDNPVQVPASLQDSLRSRLDRLGPAKAMAQFVSVLGRRFSHRLILASTPYDEAANDSALEQLIRAELLVETGTGPRRGYAFRHAMVQEVAYNSLLNKTKRSHHLRIAEAINHHFPDMVDSAPEVLASHYEYAGDIKTAIQYWHQAGQHASQAWAHSEAENHFIRAITLLGSLPQTSELAALELALRIDLVRSLRILERGNEGVAHLDRAKAIADDLQQDRELAVIYNLYGNILFANGDIEGCLSNHRAAIYSAQASSSITDEIQALSGLGDANLLKGLAVSAEKAYGDCLALCRAHQHNRFIPPNLSLRGHMRLYLNQIQQSEQDVREAIRLAQQQNDPRTEMVARGSCLAKTLCEQANYSQARVELEQALAMARTVNGLRFEALYLLFLAQTEYRDGQLANAAKWADQAIEIAANTEFRYVGAIAFGAKALVTESQSQRLEILTQGEQLLSANTPSQNYLWFLRDAMEVSLTDGRWDSAEHFANILVRYTAQQPLAWCNLYINLTRCCAAYGRREHSAENDAQICQLRSYCQQTGLYAAQRLLECLVAGDATRASSLGIYSRP